MTLFDWRGSKTTLRNSVGVFVSFDISLVGALLDWSDKKIAAAVFFTAIVALYLLGHFKPIKKASKELFILINWICFVITSVLVGLSAGWFEILINWTIRNIFGLKQTK
jgi:hypothetical protein